MTHSESTDETRRDAARTGGQLPQSDLTAGPTPPSATSPAGGGPARASSAPDGRSTGRPGAAGGAPAEGERTSEPKGLAHAGSPASSSSHGARDEGARLSSIRHEGTSDAVRGLIRCVEQLVREIPKGSAARFEGVTEEIRKARKALDGASTGSSLGAGASPEGARAFPSAPGRANAFPGEGPVSHGLSTGGANETRPGPIDL